LVAGAGVVVCGCCARDGGGPATVTAAAIPMQSAKRRNIKLSSVQAGAWRAAFSSFWLNSTPAAKCGRRPRVAFMLLAHAGQTLI
jgi:hypothetical protein